ncbi:hypothetical protein [Desulfogranum japonicum]|uniref:hypothetical protein n=1 Tax=Desulfogranum japonicum TaxID=231447 RepID=UPI0004106391|nr:hypothetical protein [Desulfogranum japonicum]
MDQLTLIMEKINLYIQDPFGMLTICTAPIIGYYAVKLYLKPRLTKKEKEQ